MYVTASKECLIVLDTQVENNYCSIFSHIRTCYGYDGVIEQRRAVLWKVARPHVYKNQFLFLCGPLALCPVL